MLDESELIKLARYCFEKAGHHLGMKMLALLAEMADKAANVSIARDGRAEGEGLDEYKRCREIAKAARGE